MDVKVYCISTVTQEIPRLLSLHYITNQLNVNKQLFCKSFAKKILLNEGLRKTNFVCSIVNIFSVQQLGSDRSISLFADGILCTFKTVAKWPFFSPFQQEKSTVISLLRETSGQYLGARD